jgi:hypothetical protein
MSVCLECDAGIGGGPSAGAAGIQGEGADPGAHHQHPLHQHLHQRHRLQRLLFLIQVWEYPLLLESFQADPHLNIASKIRIYAF